MARWLNRWYPPTEVTVKSILQVFGCLQGCVGLLTPDALDVLSHAAVRARNSSVLLATCSDAAALRGLRPLAGRTVALTISQVGMSGVISSAGSFHDVHRVVPSILL